MVVLIHYIPSSPSSVAIFTLLTHCKLEFEKKPVHILSGNKSKFELPYLEDSGAIVCGCVPVLSYLCAKYNLDHLYPSFLQKNGTDLLSDSEVAFKLSRRGAIESKIHCFTLLHSHLLALLKAETLSGSLPLPCVSSKINGKIKRHTSVQTVEEFNESSDSVNHHWVEVERILWDLEDALSPKNRTMDGSGNGVVYGGESIADLYLNSILLITNMLAVFDWKLFNNIRVYVLEFAKLFPEFVTESAVLCSNGLFSKHFVVSEKNARELSESIVGVDVEKDKDVDIRVHADATPSHLNSLLKLAKDWNVVNHAHSADIEVRLAPNAKSNQHSIFASGVFNAPLSHVKSVVLSKRKEFDPFLTGARLLYSLGPDLRLYYCTVMPKEILKEMTRTARFDFVCFAKETTFPNGDFMFSYESADIDGPVSLGFVRAQLALSGFKISKVSDDQCEISFVICSDFPGKVPSWVFSVFTLQAAQYIANIRQLVSATEFSDSATGSPKNQSKSITAAALSFHR